MHDAIMFKAIVVFSVHCSIVLCTLFVLQLIECLCVRCIDSLTYGIVYSRGLQQAACGRLKKKKSGFSFLSTKTIKSLEIHVEMRLISKIEVFPRIKRRDRVSM